MNEGDVYTGKDETKHSKTCSLTNREYLKDMDTKHERADSKLQTIRLRTDGLQDRDLQVRDRYHAL